MSASGAPALIRPMTRDDIEAVVANEKAAYDHPWSRKLLEQSLEGRDHCFVCVTDGIVAGHGIVSAVADEGHVLNICLVAITASSV